MVNNSLTSVRVWTIDHIDQLLLEALLGRGQPSAGTVRVEGLLRELVTVLVTVTDGIALGATGLHLLQAAKIEIAAI